jgi:hypothetical protein
MNEDGHQHSKKKSQIAVDAGGEAPSAPAPRPKKVPKAPKAPREGKPKPASDSGEGGHSKTDSLFMQFARLERDGWDQQVDDVLVALSARI